MKIERQKITNCPIRNVLKIIGGKWPMIIIEALSEKGGPMRFNSLMRSVPDISEKMLIQTLKSLEEHGYVKRKSYNTIPPKVEYSLLEKGRVSLKILDTLFVLDEMK